MRAGKLDSQIAIQRSVSILDDYGVPALTWSNIAVVRAQVIKASTEEFIRGYGATEDNVVVFRIRWIADIIMADRVVHDGANFDIKELKQIGRRQGLEIRAVEQ